MVSSWWWTLSAICILAVSCGWLGIFIIFISVLMGWPLVRWWLIGSCFFPTVKSWLWVSWSVATRSIFAFMISDAIVFIWPCVRVVSGWWRRFRRVLKVTVVLWWRTTVSCLSFMRVLTSCVWSVAVLVKTGFRLFSIVS